jgi:plastocyanin domain-containing protein
MKKNTIISIIISIALIGGTLYLVSNKPSSGGEVTDSQNVEIRDGIQYVTINAKGGYSPRVSNAEANIPTKLIVKTDGTYDCSSSLVIRSINYQKILPQIGEEVIDLGTPQTGTFQGTCSMGMYNFVINFNS